MNASADIQTKTHENVLAVPINAVTTREKNNDKPLNKGKDGEPGTGENIPAQSTDEDNLDEVVFILQADKKVKKVKVRTDIQDINYIEVLTGLKPGDEIITGPYNVVSKTLNDGDKVKVVPKEKLFTDTDKKG